MSYAHDDVARREAAFAADDDDYWEGGGGTGGTLQVPQIPPPAGAYGTPQEAQGTAGGAEQQLASFSAVQVPKKEVIASSTTGNIDGGKRGPLEWSEFKDNSGQIYYYNHRTDESAWEPPDAPYNPLPPENETVPKAEDPKEDEPKKQVLQGLSSDGQVPKVEVTTEQVEKVPEDPVTASQVAENPKDKADEAKDTKEEAEPKEAGAATDDEGVIKPPSKGQTGQTVKWSSILKLASWCRNGSMSDNERNWVIRNELEGFSKEEVCVHSKKGHELDTNCLAVLSDEKKAKAVTDFILWFAAMDSQSQRLYVMERIKTDKETREKQRAHNYMHFKGFMMPYISEDTELSEELKKTKICKHAFMKLLHIGRKYMQSLSDHLKKGTEPETKVKRTNYWTKRFDEKIKPALEVFFQESMYPLAVPRQSKFDHMMQKTLPMGDSNMIQELDPEWSKRRSYSLYCSMMGYHVQTDAVGRMKMDPIEGFPEPKKDICSWKSFLTYWSKEHPLLHVSHKQSIKRKPEKKKSSTNKKRAFASLGEEPHISDVFKAFPFGCRPLLELHDIYLRRADSPLSIADRELVATFVSATNACEFCVGAHSIIAEEFGVSESLLERLVELSKGEEDDGNVRMKEDLSEVPAGSLFGHPVKRRNALCKFMRILTLTPSKVTPEIRNACITTGTTSEELHEVIVICGLFSMMNRIVDGHGVKTSDVNKEATRKRHKSDVSDGAVDRSAYIHFAEKIGVLD